MLMLNIKGKGKPCGIMGNYVKGRERGESVKAKGECERQGREGKRKV